MPIARAVVDRSRLNQAAVLPYELRLEDFEAAMRDVYDFFFDVNTFLASRGLERLDEMLRPANMSGLLSDMLTTSLAKHSRILRTNRYPNGHPDLIVQGRYPSNAVQAGEDGVEVKSTRKPGGAVDTHGAREQCLATFVYKVDNETEPVIDRAPMAFTELYVGRVSVDDFRHNPRGALGTRTATLHKEGILRFREKWVYRVDEPATVGRTGAARGAGRRRGSDRPR